MNVILLILNLILLLFSAAIAYLYSEEKRNRLTLKKFLDRVSRTAREVRYGNLSRRLRSSLTTETKMIAKDINKMIETLNDREIMIKSYQGELEKQKKELEEMIEMQEDFTATLTHDLKVPILAEINALKLFKEEHFGNINDNQRYALDTMLKSNEELLFLVNTLLNTYKYRYGDAGITKKESCLVKTINECLNEISFLVKEHVISFQSEYPELVFCFDKVEIKRVIKNLLSNAITNTSQDGHIEVCLEIVGDSVQIRVSDDGKGIEQKDLDMIFKKYYSANKKFRKVGTGLGLFLSKQIIEQHDGQIWASSKIDEGSSFYFTIPLSEVKS